MSFFPSYDKARRTLAEVVQSRLDMGLYAASIFAAPDSGSKNERFHQFVDKQLLSWSAQRCNTARQLVLKARSAQEVEDALLQMVTHEDTSRQFWVEQALRPWCERHGMTLRQGLSVLMDDAAFNPDKDLPIKENVFWPGGQHLDFASRLAFDLAATASSEGKVMNVQLVRWDVCDGSSVRQETEPTYEATVSASPGEIHIDIEPRIDNARQFATAQETESPLDDLPGMRIGIEVVDGCPVVHVYGRGVDELRQSIFALPGHGSAKLVSRPGDAPSPVAVPSGFSPNLHDVVQAFERANAYLKAWTQQQELLALEDDAHIVAGDTP